MDAKAQACWLTGKLAIVFSLKAETLNDLAFTMVMQLA